jgi:hypothetical protein
MNSDFAVPPTRRSLVFKIIAWVLWIIFLLAAAGLFVVAEHVQSEIYFVAYYGHHPMNQLTVLTTTHPVWITLVPLLWLPFVIAYQRQNHPRGVLLLPLSVTMFIAAMVVALLILFSGPPIQM